ncbi:MAG: ornithine cyclodeaminase family protein [Dermabacter sp.]|nr:ornithine cyclodeaminase family protein [Dermabacter sp.]
MRTFTESDVLSLGYAAAADALTAALHSGFDPATDPERTFTDVPHGTFLTMPTSVGAHAGIKVATLAPGNPERGLPFVQATYLLHDAETLSLKATLDGTALTTLRTPAVAIAGARPYLRALMADGVTAPRVLIYGAGAQGVGHAHALADEFPELGNVDFVVRSPERAGADARGLGQVHALGSAPAAKALAGADVIVCATAAREPLFADEDVPEHAVILAVGAHQPDVRELPAALLARSDVIVEDVATALREAGDVVLAIADGAITEGDLVPMRDLLRRGEGATAARPRTRPAVIKTVGMSWQDLVVAAAVMDAHPEG